MTDNLYYITRKDKYRETKRLVSLNEYCFLNMKEGAFWDYLRNLIQQEDIEDIAIDVDISKEETHGWVGYVMPENWKHLLVDKYATDVCINDIEEYIASIGMRRTFRFANECDFYEEENYKEALQYEDGLRRLFYAMLWVLIDINDNKDCDGEEYINEFEEDDYKTQMGDDQESDDEESDE
jgi:hypothetical protein